MMGKTLADLEKEMNQEFFVAEKNIAEVRNQTKKPIFVTAIRGAVSDRIYVYIWKDEGFEVKPNGYRLIPIEKESLSSKQTCGFTSCDDNIFSQNCRSAIKISKCPRFKTEQELDAIHGKKETEQEQIQKLVDNRKPLGPPPHRYVRKGHKSDARV